ncbi:DUF4365 domain-containing protein [Ligilactobacillus pobuzihii]|nr:DUF4365 domain-containing protein [Ligilactobacillus pobuzihii]GEN49086.1 hypothetical protein LPO01_18780 [Ligilactobacillus pobuzihii]
MHMDRKRIEEIAVSEVKQLFLKHSKRLNSELSQNDKGISFDGSIILFKDEAMSKRSYLSKIPVQVKGTEVKKFSKKVASYNKIDKSTFKNFQLEDGVVFFYVELLQGSSLKSKIFFKFLDVDTLEQTLENIEEKGQSTKTIELNEIQTTDNLDKIFNDIAVKRKARGFSNARMETYLKNDSTFKTDSDLFNQQVIEKAYADVQKNEYLDKDSNFNQILQKDMICALKQGIIFDKLLFLKLKLLIDKGELIKKLPKKNRQLAILVSARYFVSIKDFNSAKRELREYQNDPNMEEEFYEKVKIEANLDNPQFMNIIKNSRIKNSKKNKYFAMYYLENNKLAKFYDMNSFFNIDEDWMYLSAKYFSLLGHMDKVEEILRKVHDKRNFEIDVLEVNAKVENLVHSFFYNTEKISPKVIEDLEIRIKELENKKKKEETLKKIEFSSPMLENLKFNYHLLSNPKKEIKYVNEKLAKQTSNDSLIKKKLKLLLALKYYHEGINFIDNLSKLNKNNYLVEYKILFYQKNLQFTKVQMLTSQCLETIGNTCDQDFVEFLIFAYMGSIVKSSHVSIPKFEDFITKLRNSFHFDLPLLLCLENTRKIIQSHNYGKSFGKIVTEFERYPDFYKIYDMKVFLLRTNEINLAQKMYPYFKKIDKKFADEMMVEIFSTNNMPNEVLKILSEYEDCDLTCKEAAFKAKSFNELKQFSATIGLYYHLKNYCNDDNLGAQVMMAFLSISADKNDVKALAQRGINSENRFFRLNSALALVYYGISIQHGLQTLEKDILKMNFNDKELNRAFLSVWFQKVHSIEEDKSIDNYDDTQLKWFKFNEKSTGNSAEFIIVPEDWHIMDFNKIQVMGLNSDFKICTQILSTNDEIFFNNKSLILIEQKTLSMYIFQELLKREVSKENTSDSFMYSINTDSKNILDKLISVLKKTDNSSFVAKAEKLQESWHAPFIFNRLVNKDNLIEFYIKKFADTENRYYVGQEKEYLGQKDYQISTSSLMFLAHLNLLPILNDYSNLWVAKSKVSFFDSYYSRILKDSTIGRMLLVNGQFQFIEPTKEERNKLKESSRKILIASRNLKQNRVNLIDPKLKKLFLTDSVDMQIAHDNNFILFSEDEAEQTICSSSFGITICSVGTLISHFYLDLHNDASGYLEILLKVLNEKNAWKLERDNLKKLSKLTLESSDDEKLVTKFHKWFKLYKQYFNIWGVGFL